jgi:hypothetical protein
LGHTARQERYIDELVEHLLVAAAPRRLLGRRLMYPSIVNVSIHQ